MLYTYIYSSLFNLTLGNGKQEQQSHLSNY
jgi:hypothetical protein